MGQVAHSSQVNYPLSKSRFLRNRKKREIVLAYLFCLPALLLFFVFRFWPLLEAAQMSLHRFNLLTGKSTYVGFANFSRALADPAVFEALRATLLFVVAKVPLQLILALALALFVQRQTKGIALVRSAIFTPVVTAMVVAATLWTLMYHPTHGLINSFISSLGMPRIPFLTRPVFALPAVTLALLWKDVGLSMMFFLAGLQGIPETFYEAGSIDGTTRWTKFRYITLPLLRRTTMFVLITNTITTFQLFTPIYVMTKGGPSESTRTIVYYIYQLAFIRNDMGYASAVSVILFLIILTISLIQMRLMRTDFEY